MFENVVVAPEPQKAASGLSKQEQRRRVTELFKTIDQLVRDGEFEAAMEFVRKIYEYDIKNLYARAYEERILAQMMQKERREALVDAARKADEMAQAEVKRQLKEFFAQQEIESKKRKVLEEKEKELEKAARKASFEEARNHTAAGPTVGSRETVQQLEALEHRLIDQVREMLENSGKHRRAGESFAVEGEDREKFHALLTQQFTEEHRRAQESLIKKMEADHEVILNSEQVSRKNQNLAVYRSMIASMLQLKLSPEISAALQGTLRRGFSLSAEDHAESEKIAQRAAFIDALRERWQAGKPSEEDLGILRNLQSFYGISDDEQVGLLRLVKKELGLPDASAVIMVIDDDPGIRSYIEHVLQASYARVISVASVEAAVESLRTDRPDLIISDVNFGPKQTSGLSFLEKLKEGAYGDNLKQIPFVMMSSFVDEFFVKSARKLGVHSYMTKPFTKQGLETSVREALA